jgi:Ca2+-binding RTX toxin-like protein
MRASFLAAVALLATFAPPASAARLSSFDGVTAYDAGPGEANRMTVVRGDRQTRFEDRGATIDVAGACRSITPHVAECDNATQAEVRTHDGDDRVTSHGVPLRLGEGDDRGELEMAGGELTLLLGEGGNDELLAARAAGGAGDDVVAGTDGDDHLAGGPGRDRVEGRGGDDRLTEGECCGVVAPAADVYDGGRGRDTITYDGRETPLVIDLAAGRGGTGGDEDRLVDLEGAFGGWGDDVLLGSPGPDELGGSVGSDVVLGHSGDDRLDGGQGADRVEGGDGSDVLDGGPQDDVLDGGGGDDAIEASGGLDTLRGGDGADRLSGGLHQDSIDGGEGADVVHAEGDLVSDAVACGGAADSAFVDVGDRLDATCEAVERIRAPLPPVFRRLGGPLVPTVRVGPRAAQLTVHCDALIAAGVEGGTIHLYVGGRRAGSGIADCGDSLRGTLRSRTRVLVRLRRRALRLARRPRGVRAVAVARLGLQGQLPIRGRLRLVAR